MTIAWPAGKRPVFVGAGWTMIRRYMPRTKASNAKEAATMAINDAGLKVSDIDGIFILEALLLQDRAIVRFYQTLEFSIETGVGGRPHGEWLDSKSHKNLPRPDPSRAKRDTAIHSFSVGRRGGPAKECLGEGVGSKKNGTAGSPIPATAEHGRSPHEKR